MNWHCSLRISKWVNTRVTIYHGKHSVVHKVQVWEERNTTIGCPFMYSWLISIPVSLDVPSLVLFHVWLLLWLPPVSCFSLCGQVIVEVLWICQPVSVEWFKGLAPTGTYASQCWVILDIWNIERPLCLVSCQHQALYFSHLMCLILFSLKGFIRFSTRLLCCLFWVNLMIEAISWWIFPMMYGSWYGEKTNNRQHAC